MPDEKHVMRFRGTEAEALRTFIANLPGPATGDIRMNNRILKSERPQPTPAGFFVAHCRDGRETVTLITRIWKPGDTAHCRLCPFHECRVNRNVCQLRVEEYVAEADAALYSWRHEAQEAERG